MLKFPMQPKNQKKIKHVHGLIGDDLALIWAQSNMALNGLGTTKTWP